MLIRIRILIKSYVNLWPLVYSLYRAPFWASMPPYWASMALHGFIVSSQKLLNFEFNADPNPAFHSNTDPDPGSHNNSDPQPWFFHTFFGFCFKIFRYLFSENCSALSWSIGDKLKKRERRNCKRLIISVMARPGPRSAWRESGG